MSSANSLPSARNDTDTSRLLLGAADSALLGNPSNPFVVTLRAAYRAENRDQRPSQTDFTGSTLFNPYDSRCTTANCLIFGNLPTSTFGNIRTAQNLEQRYTEFNGSANRLFGSHDLKFGMNFLRTGADGADSRLLQTQLFASTTPISSSLAPPPPVRTCWPPPAVSHPAPTRFTSRTTTRRSSRRTTGGSATT